MSVLSELKDLANAYSQYQAARAEEDRLKWSKPEILALSRSNVRALEEFAADHPQEVESAISGEGSALPEDSREAILAAREAVEAHAQALAEQRKKVIDTTAALDAETREAKMAATLVAKDVKSEEQTLKSLQEKRCSLVSERDSKVAEKEEAMQSAETALKKLPGIYRKKDEQLAAQLKKLKGKQPSYPQGERRSYGCRVVVMGTLVTLGLSVVATGVLSIIVAFLPDLYPVLSVLMSTVLGATSILFPILGYGGTYLWARAKSNRECQASIQAQLPAYQQAYEEWAKRWNEVAEKKNKLPEEQAAEQAELSRKPEQCKADIEAIQAEYRPRIIDIDEQIQSQEEILTEKKAAVPAASPDEARSSLAATLAEEKSKLAALDEKTKQLNEQYYLSLGPILAQMQEEAREAHQRSLDEASSALKARESRLQDARNISGMSVPYPTNELPHLNRVIEKIESGRASTVMEAFNLLDQDRQRAKSEAELELMRDEYEAQLAELRKEQEELEKRRKQDQETLRRREAEIEQLQQEHEEEMNELTSDYNELVDELEYMEADAQEEEEKAYCRCTGCAHYEGSRGADSWRSFRSTFCKTGGLDCTDSLDCYRYRRR